MYNPYINNTQTSADNSTQTNAPYQPGIMQTVDNTINNMGKDLPFVPDNFNLAGFVKGLIIGAGVTYLLTNEKAQQALFSAIIKAGDLLQGGFEELKERFEDTKAELNAK